MFKSFSVLCVSISTVALTAGGILCYFHVTKCRANKERRELVEKRHPWQNVNEALFYPVNNFPCRRFIVSKKRCSLRRCRFLHEETSASKMCRYLLEATSSIDCCILLFTNKDLAWCLTEARQRGVRVRMLTDRAMCVSGGSRPETQPSERLKLLIECGVEVCQVDSENRMHHKFAVLDGRLLITGSYNWTAQATLCNWDNVMVSSTPALVQPYCAQFEAMWGKYQTGTAPLAPPALSLGATWSRLCQLVLGSQPTTKAPARVRTLHPVDRVVFFPDSGFACRPFLFSPAGCHKKNCTYLHQETAISAMCSYLEQAKESVDCCLYCFSNVELKQSLLKACRRKVRVRILIDEQKSQPDRDLLNELKHKGAKLCLGQSNYLIHHKFAVVDCRLVISGSFNWTVHGALGNYDSAVITSNPALVDAYVRQFAVLWEKFTNPDPEAMRPTSIQSHYVKSSAWDGLIVGHEPRY